VKPLVRTGCRPRGRRAGRVRPEPVRHRSSGVGRARCCAVDGDGSHRYRGGVAGGAPTPDDGVLPSDRPVWE